MQSSKNLLKGLNRPIYLFLNNARQLSLTSKCSAKVNEIFEYDKDPGPHFINPKVQELLKSVTRIRLDKVYRKRNVPDNSIEYEFLTTEAVEKKFKESLAKAEEFLQMPPIVKVKVDEHKIISKDPALTHFSDSKYIITDITFGLKDSQRKVLIRHTDGTLEHAPLHIHKRMNQTYFPIPGRKIRIPKMFEADNLDGCLQQENYEFILDRLCVQFEPYEKEFHDISAKVYLHINENKKFDDLRSTRHFGPMTFFFAWHKMIDDLLYDMIKRDYLRNGVELICLMYELNGIPESKNILAELKKHPESSVREYHESPLPQTTKDIHDEIKNAIGKSAEDFVSDEICFTFIHDYVNSKALKKTQLELALQTYKESNDEKKKLYEGLIKAHGII